MVNEYSEKMVGCTLHFHSNILYHGQVSRLQSMAIHTTYRKNRTASEWQEIWFGWLDI